MFINYPSNAFVCMFARKKKWHAIPKIFKKKVCTKYQHEPFWIFGRFTDICLKMNLKGLRLGLKALRFQKEALGTQNQDPGTQNEARRTQMQLKDLLTRSESKRT